mgnify:CR=1 FL=1
MYTIGPGLLRQEETCIVRIAAIAMSGTRSANPALVSLGRSKPSFAKRWDIIASLPSLALLTVAGMTPKRHEMKYFEIADVRALNGLPRDYDLVAISSYTAQVYQAYDLARQYRALGIPTVIGGPHVSVVPEEAAEHCDAVVIGQGELTWLDVLRDCEGGRLKPFYGALDAEFDLEEAPMPAFELLDVSKYTRITVQTSRGCPHRCEFCASSVLLSGGYKQKPAEKVLAEVDKVRQIWPHPFIEFADDNSFVCRAYWREELLPELKKRKLRWFAEADLSIAEDEVLLRLMRESGCAQVLIGVESPREEDLDGLDLKTNWKKYQCATCKEAIRTIQSSGITVNGCFVLGMDTQGPEIFDAVYDFVRETELFDVQITILTPFPGTPLYDRLKRESRLLEERPWDKCTLFDVTFKPKGMSIETLQRGFFELGARLFDEEVVKWRQKNFKKYWRQAVRT